MMNSKEEQLKEQLLAIKRTISSKIASIDRILDQMGYGKELDNQEELVSKQEQLSDDHRIAREIDDDISKSEGILKRIDSLEDSIDTIQLYTFQSARIEALKKEIEESTLEREKLLVSIGERIEKLKETVNQR